MENLQTVLKSSFLATFIGALMLFNVQFNSFDEMPSNLFQMSELVSCTITIDCGSADKQCFSSTAGSTTIIVNGGIDNIDFEGDCPIGVE